MEFSATTNWIVRFIDAGSERPVGPPGLAHHLLGAAFAVMMFSWATPARADPCEGQLPSAPGQIFDGLVRYVGDGDSLCIGQSPDPQTWIEVRLADFDAPELHAPEGRRAKMLLEQVAFGRSARCEARRGRSGRVISHDRIIAVCRVDGRSIGDLLRERNAPEGGN